MITDKKREGKIFVISAPSGCGKTTLCKKLLDDKLSLVPSVSFTTRKPRKGEKEGRDYFFVSEKGFSRMIRRREFLEYEENFGNFYGTPKKKIEELLKKDKNILLSIDVKGAMNVRRSYPGESVLIFILPPSFEDLKKRLTSRMADPAHSISSRLKIAKKEIAYKDRYDYTVVNDSLDTAYRKLKRIIIAETGL